jgi:hypothetical protein
MQNPGADVDPALSGDVERLTLEVLRLRDIVRGSEAQIGELTTRLSRLDEQRKISEQLWIDRLEHTDRQLAEAVARAAALESSTSWRVGQFILRPVDVWRRAVGR